MTTSTKDIINRIKNLTEHTITIELPEDFMFTGTIPFDMQIKGTTVQVRVLALDEFEAKNKIYEYFYK
jgi:hypothetical protein